MEISDKDIQQLAELTIENGKVNAQVAEFVLTKLSKGDLKKYLANLKQIFNKNRVYVTISDASVTNLKKTLEEAFKGKEVIFTEDKTIGAGFKAQMGDTIIDMTMKNYLEETVDKLKETL